DHRERIFELAATRVIAPGTGADAPEIEAQRRDSEFLQRARDRMHHLVLQAAAVQWMRMADHRKACPAAGSTLLEQRLEPARRTLDRQYLGERRARAQVCLPGWNSRLAELMQ